jgi:hypothetical protein
LNTDNGISAGLTIDLEEDGPALPALPIVDETGAAIVDEDADLQGSLPARAIRNGDGSITLPLLMPVTLTVRSAQRGTRSETYSVLTLHPLVGADLRALQAASKESGAVVMLARSARIREGVMNVLFDKMSGRDITEASEVVESFFGSGRKTGRST